MNKKDQEIKEKLQELHGIAQLLLRIGVETKDPILTRIGGTIRIMMMSVVNEEFEEMMSHVDRFVQESIARKEEVMERAITELMRDINSN